MNLLEANLESLSNDELNFLAAEARKFAAVGYYGPTANGKTHTDYHRYDTKAEALEQYVKHWLGEPGCVCGADMDEDDVSLCYWKENWGPLVCPCPADGDDGIDGMTFEQWFFEQYPQFTMQVLVNNSHSVLNTEGKLEYSVDISHDTHATADAYFSGTDEPRLRTLTILEVLKKKLTNANS